MAGCDGRFTCDFKHIFIITITCLLLTYSMVSSRKTEYQTKFKDLPSELSRKQIESSRHLPLCLILRQVASKGSKLEDIVYRLWKGKEISDSHKPYFDWQYGSFTFEKYKIFPDVKPEKFPALRCYIGKESYYQYEGRTNSQSVEQWFEVLTNKHAEQLEDGTPEKVQAAKQKHDFVILAFPDEPRHIEIEEMAFNYCDEQESCKAFIIHEYAPDIKQLQQEYGVKWIPAVVLIHKDRFNKSNATDRIVKVIDGPQLKDIKLRVYLYAWQMSVPHYSSERLKSAVTEPSSLPLMVVIYSAFHPYTMFYLKSFRRAVEEFQKLDVNVKFGLIDFAEKDGKTAFNRVIDNMKAKKFPCTVLLYHDMNGQLMQSVLGTDLYPSLLSIHEFLTTEGKFVDNSSQPLTYHPFPPISPDMVTALYEGPHGSMCSPVSHNQTNNTPFVKPKPKPKPRKKKKNSLWHDMFGTEKMNKKLKKLNGIPLLTKSYWSDIIERSHAPNHLLQGGKQWAGEVTKVALVIFIIEGCGNCVNKMDTFKQVQKSVRYIAGGSVYIVNCTAEVQLCAQHQINGFPTITAFRGLGWLHGDRCISTNSQEIYQKHVRLNYHGVITEKLLMEWFSNAAAPAVVDKMFDWPEVKNMSMDVGLFGVLIPRYSSFLPLTPNRKMDYFYSYDCFRLACERLYGKVQCYSVFSNKIPPREYEKDDIDAIVSEVTLKRKDGASAVVMEMGVNLAITLEDISDPTLHTFHKTHSYDVRSDQRCEHDHALCTDLITSYALDHSRMPVTHITTDIFHIDDSVVSEENLPVVIALVHPSNITENANFLQSLNSAATELYNEVSVFTINVDQFPAWSGHFIPNGYRYTMMAEPKGENDPQQMFVFPRLCFIYKHDHEHAAFYPPLGKSRQESDWFSANEMVSYAKKFLENPDEFMIKTEPF